MKLAIRLLIAILLIAAVYKIVANFDQSVDFEPKLDHAAGFSYRTLKGEFILTVELQGPGPHGLQVEGGALALKTVNDQAGHTSVQGNVAIKALAQVSQAEVFQVERQQDTLIFSVARRGDPLQQIATVPAPAGQSLRTGYYGAAASARNLRWTIPAWKELVQYKNFLGSQLELLNIETGAREIIYATRATIATPNWTADGKFIQLSSAGRIYQIELATKKLSKLDTGTRTQINFNHVVSFDGKWLGITNSSQETSGGAMVYKLPVGGGEPQALTRQAPSYLHGWSPDGKYILYSASRSDRFNVYRTTTDGAGHEVQLTESKGTNGGAEYAPDGKHIYFNSSRTGLMQLWRMEPDGSNAQQLTNDNYNNWFPHVSPDNRQLVFMSYSPTVKADELMFYQPVYLRAMPVGGGQPKVIAYVYGGQGTINVRSWSPDGKTVAFISNTVFPDD